MRPVRTLLTLAVVMALCAPAALAQQLMGPPSWITSQTAVGLTATLVAPSRPTRLAVRVTQITGAQQVFCGPTNAVTIANGQLIPATVGAFIDVQTRAEVWCITTVAPQTVSAMENY